MKKSYCIFRINPDGSETEVKRTFDAIACEGWIGRVLALYPELDCSQYTYRKIDPPKNHLQKNQISLHLDPAKVDPLHLDPAKVDPVQNTPLHPVFNAEKNINKFYCKKTGCSECTLHHHPHPSLRRCIKTRIIIYERTCIPSEAGMEKPKCCQSGGLHAGDARTGRK